MFPNFEMKSSHIASNEYNWAKSNKVHGENKITRVHSPIVMNAKRQAISPQTQS